MNNSIVRILTALALAGTAAAQAQTATLSVEQARRQIAPFYEMLNRPAAKDLGAIAERVLAPDWKSYAGERQFKGRDAFVAQAAAFGQLIPDLRWDIKEVLVHGNRVVVRSEASGTPAGPFFGVQPSGKSFSIMAIDIHTIAGGKITTSYHVEDWAGAIRQLTEK